MQPKESIKAKIKDIFHGPHRSFAWTVVGVTGIFLIVWTFGPGNTFVGWIRAKRDISSMERQIQEYGEKTSEMDARIHELRGSRDSLEKFARERFYFSASGEDIYIDGE